MQELCLGLRVDVDTHEGRGRGVPRLLDLFQGAGVQRAGVHRAGVSASFYFSMGPDNSGRAIFNLLRPGFLAKMRRTAAPRVYGWRTVLSGTLLPSRPIALAFPEVARRAAEQGHETGVHAWNHRRWQDRLLNLKKEQIAAELDRGRQAYRSIFERHPTTYAAPAWLSCEEAILHQESLGLTFASDCRGVEPFWPRVRGCRLETPQVPATLPTLDELLGLRFATATQYFNTLLAALRPGTWPVLTLHAELEGGPYADAFAAFLRRGLGMGVRFLTLGQLLERRLAHGELPICGLPHRPVAGRHGVVSTQSGVDLPDLEGPASLPLGAMA